MVTTPPLNDTSPRRHPAGTVELNAASRVDVLTKVALEQVFYLVSEFWAKIFVAHSNKQGCLHPVCVCVCVCVHVHVLRGYTWRGVCRGGLLGAHLSVHVLETWLLPAGWGFAAGSEAAGSKIEDCGSPVCTAAPQPQSECWSELVSKSPGEADDKGQVLGSSRHNVGRRKLTCFLS